MNERKPAPVSGARQESMPLDVHVKPVNKQDDAADNNGVIDQYLFPARGTVMDQPGDRYEQNAQKPDRQ